MHFRPFEANVGEALSSEYEVRARGKKFEVHAGPEYPALRVYVHGQDAQFTNDGGSTRDIFYERDAERGYESSGSLWSPGYFTVPLPQGASVTLIASTEDWRTISALDPEAAYTTERDRRQRLLRISHPKAQEGTAAELVLAADQFIMTPAGFDRLRVAHPRLALAFVLDLGRVLSTRFRELNRRVAALDRLHKLLPPGPPGRSSESIPHDVKRNRAQSLRLPRSGR